MVERKRQARRAISKVGSCFGVTRSSGWGLLCRSVWCAVGLRQRNRECSRLPFRCSGSGASCCRHRRKLSQGAAGVRCCSGLRQLAGSPWRRRVVVDSTVTALAFTVASMPRELACGSHESGRAVKVGRESGASSSRYRAAKPALVGEGRSLYQSLEQLTS